MTPRTDFGDENDLDCDNDENFARALRGLHRPRMVATRTHAVERNSVLLSRTATQTTVADLKFTGSRVARTIRGSCCVGRHFARSIVCVGSLFGQLYP